MYPFDYARPHSLTDAVALLRADADARPLAGGQSLLPILKHRLARPSILVDLGRIAELRGIRILPERIRIGAMTCHAEVARDADVRRLVPALAELARGIADPSVRNLGTLGGALALNDPGADYPAAVLGLAAVIVTDRRRIDADTFFLGAYTTALAADELIVAVEFPIPRRAGYVKFPHPASGYVLAGAFVAEFDAAVRVAVNGAGACVFRVPEMERALLPADASVDPADVRVAAEGLLADHHADAQYRAQLATVAIRRAIQRLTNPTS
jgi:carbon-monoxide dehydrogenase medium subunit